MLMQDPGLTLIFAVAAGSLVSLTLLVAFMIPVANRAADALEESARQAGRIGDFLMIIDARDSRAMRDFTELSDKYSARFNQTEAANAKPVV